MLDGESRSDGCGLGLAQAESSLLWNMSGSAGVRIADAIMTELHRGSRMATVVGVER